MVLEPKQLNFIPACWGFVSYLFRPCIELFINCMKYVLIMYVSMSMKADGNCKCARNTFSVQYG